jgi:hypothetical protein
VVERAVETGTTLLALVVLVAVETQILRVPTVVREQQTLAVAAVVVALTLETLLAQMVEQVL